MKREIGKWTYWIATLPSIEPRANPSAPGNTAIVLVCHFNGEVTVYPERNTKENSTISQVFKPTPWTGEQEVSTDLARRDWVREVEYLDMPARCSDHQHLVLDVHSITSFLEFDSNEWSGRSEIPILIDIWKRACFPASVTSDHVLGKRRRSKYKLEKQIHLQCFVPATSGKNSSLGGVEPPHALDRTFMMSYLGGGTRYEVEHSRGIVGPR
jgi:hypothetical protein